ncbi:MAG: hypothetical protein CM1200mP29_10380 [Verrucomicrobiota bacterium]|nr:MAG: hypothetical protein CM1200mP29_10380 [Verrucomicrobiota bacterium]
MAYPKKPSADKAGSHVSPFASLSLVIRVPIEIYIFTDTTVWAEYEAIQADIFDHLLAVIPRGSTWRRSRIPPARNRSVARLMSRWSLAEPCLAKRTRNLPRGQVLGQATSVQTLKAEFCFGREGGSW